MPEMTSEAQHVCKRTSPRPHASQIYDPEIVRNPRAAVIIAIHSGDDMAVFPSQCGDKLRKPHLRTTDSKGRKRMKQNMGWGGAHRSPDMTRHSGTEKGVTISHRFPAQIVLGVATVEFCRHSAR